MKSKIEEAKSAIKKAKNIMVLSGAGLSTEAGVPDFRSPQGLYSKEFKGYNPETVLSHSFFLNHPDLFYEYIRTYMNYQDLKPSYSYKLLEKNPKIKMIVTQNIDGLHKGAGSQNVFEVHGTMRDFYCLKCKKHYSVEEMMKDHSYQCDCGGLIRPDVVLYEENVKDIESVISKVEEMDLLLVLGSSLQVYPVASLPQIFISWCKPVIIINEQETPYKNDDYVIEINDEIKKTISLILHK